VACGLLIEVSTRLASLPVPPACASTAGTGALSCTSSRCSSGGTRDGFGQGVLGGAEAARIHAGGGGSMTLKTDQIKEAHYALLEAYGLALEKVSCLSFFGTPTIPGNANPDKLLRRLYRGILKIAGVLVGLFSLKPLVRYFVESHIKNELREIKTIYLQQSMMILPTRPGAAGYKKWSNTVLPELIALEETLLSWKSLFNAAGSILATMATFILALFGLNSVPEISLKVGQAISILAQKPALEFALYLAALVLIVYFFSNLFGTSFSVKRRLFLDEAGDQTIYSLENALFERLERKKPLEFPMQRLFIYMYLLGLPIFMLTIDTIRKSHQIPPLFTFPGNLIALLLVVVFYFVTLPGRNEAVPR
jgi:thiosulfate reductase cytochrome b subunit